jgi:hypothetical protein
MSKLVLPERSVIVEPQIVEDPRAAEFYTDGAVCRFKDGLVHILAYRLFNICGQEAHQHLATWHMPSSSFDPSFVCAFWRWQEHGPASALGSKIMH